MSDSDFEAVWESTATVDDDYHASLEDITICCVDCSTEFLWSVGEQVFFLEKNFVNQPKRCKPCKRAKNRRIIAIEIARATGKRQHIEAKVECARCERSTTVPFYPCQGRPVYCRTCYEEMNPEVAMVASRLL